MVKMYQWNLHILEPDNPKDNRAFSMLPYIVAIYIHAYIVLCDDVIIRLPLRPIVKYEIDLHNHALACSERNSIS